VEHNEVIKNRILSGLNLSAAALMMTAGLASAQVDRGAYLITSTGEAVRAAGYGVCVRSSNWTPAQATEQCDPDLLPRKAAAPAPAAPPRPSKSPPAGVVPLVLQHRWLPIDTDPSAPWQYPKFGMYTFVIYTGPTAVSKEANTLDNEAVLLFQSLLSALDQKLKADTTVTEADLSLTNVFVVPHPKHAARLNASLYNTKLASHFRGRFAVALQNDPQLKSLISGERAGPFLLSTLVPIDKIVRARGATFDIDEKQPILMVDLTGQPKQMVAHVVAEFTRYVGNHTLSEQKLLESYRTRLISALLRLNEAIPFVATAVGDTMSLLGGAGSNRGTDGGTKP
jgi:hypothetical protein